MDTDKFSVVILLHPRGWGSQRSANLEGDVALVDCYNLTTILEGVVVGYLVCSRLTLDGYGCAGRNEVCWSIVAVVANDVGIVRIEVAILLGIIL